MKYKTFVLEVPEGQITIIQGIDKEGNVWSIPTDLSNTDYQNYLATVEKKAD
jgi:hypothetical protein